MKKLQQYSLQLFKALSDPNRMTLFHSLCQCTTKTNVKEISKCCDVDMSVISRHLKTLKNAGLLDGEKKGKEVFYSTNRKEVARRLREFADLIENCCGQTKE